MNRKLGFILLIALLIGVWWAIWATRSEVYKLPDGSLLSIDSVKYGRTNVFLDGTLIEKTFRRWLPTNGITLFSHQLKPPTEQPISSSYGECLVIRFRLTNPNERENILLGRRHSTTGLVALESASGHIYISYLGQFWRSRNPKHWQAYAILDAFPRQRHLRAKVFGPDGTVIAELPFRNPMPHGTPQTWKEVPTNQINIDGLHVEFGQVEVPKPTNRLIYGHLPAATLPLKVSNENAVLTNWGIYEAVFREPSGNYGYSAWKTITNGSLHYRVIRFLEPAVPWKIEFDLAKDAEFEPDELCTVSTAFRPSSQSTMHTCRDHTIEVNYRNTDHLNLRLITTNDNVRLTFVDAIDDQGRKLLLGSGNWGQHHLSRKLEYRRIENGVHHLEEIKPDTVINLTFAVHTNYQAEVVLPPAQPAGPAHSSRR